MSNISNSLAEFGARHGRPGLQLPANGAASVTMDGLEITIFERHEDLIAASIVPAPFLETARLLAILQSCDARRRRPDEPMLQIAQRGKASDLCLIVSVRLPGETLSAAQLNQSAEALLRFRKDWLS